MKIAIVTILILLLSACGNPINRHTAANYHDWGLEAEYAGDYKLAERNYERALFNARIGRSPDAGISMASYNLGRVKGYLCKHEEAESLLVEALRLEEKATGPESGITTMRLFELARLHSDLDQYEKAVPYYERAIPTAKKLGIEGKDPIAFASVLDDYSSALMRVGKSQEARIAKREADTLREKNFGKKPQFVPVSYKQKCEK